MRSHEGLTILMVAAATLGLACEVEDETTEEIVMLPDAAGNAAPDGGRNGGVNPRMLRRFQPVTGPAWAPGVELTPARVALGRRLFEDKRLSRDGTVACATCHDITRFGVDGQPTSTGVDQQRGVRNAPTVLNAAGHFRQFWDGRADTIEAQAGGPILNPIEMAMPSEASVVAVLQKDASYPASFREAFPGDDEPVTFENLGRAIGAYERTLTTRGAWDRYLEGDANALSPAQQEGLKTFLKVGCMVCHTGPYVGGMTFERVGIVEPWPNQTDQGRFDLTHHDGDRMSFKVPSLRNVAMTAPYFHDGSAPTLDVAVQMMAKHQLGLDLEPTEIASIVTWLGSLTGEVVGADALSKSRPAAPSSAAPALSGSASPSNACGGSNQPPCPLQSWMRGSAQPALDAGDPKRLEKAFKAMVGFQPEGYGNWASIAATGAAAARDGDTGAAVKACQQCHGTYRARYRKEMRARPLQ